MPDYTASMPGENNRHSYCRENFKYHLSWNFLHFHGTFSQVQESSCASSFDTLGLCCPLGCWYIGHNGCNLPVCGKGQPTIWMEWAWWQTRFYVCPKQGNIILYKYSLSFFFFNLLGRKWADKRLSRILTRILTI